MRGMAGAKAAIRALLEDRVPAVVTGLAEGDGILPDEIVERVLPRLYAEHEAPQLALDDWPAIVVVGQDTSGLRLVDLTAGDGAETLEEWEATYRLRIFTFARAQTFEQVSGDRDRLTLAVRTVLLERLSGGDVDGRIDPGTIRESYSDVMPDELGRSVAAAFVELDVTLSETLARTADAIAVGTDLDAHPAL